MMLAAAAAVTLSAATPQVLAAPDRAAVVAQYAEIASAMYDDALSTARDLARAVDALIAHPDASTLRAARAAWRNARVPYMQTEVYRFGNPIVDDWEGKVNAWPLDEGLLDYVDGSYGGQSEDNPLYVANVIGNERITFGTNTIDASRITRALLTDALHEIGGVEANVATGYHAIEFLLWGQDLNGTGAGNGTRAWSDYAQGAACTNGHCERRASYLKVATDLLVDDLAWMAAQWAPDGAARKALAANGAAAGLSAMLTGLGSLSYGELAGERMKLGLLLHDPEEEHDCFSDNTHDSHYYNVMGMLAVYHGSYTRRDGSRVAGPGLHALVAALDPALDRELQARLGATHGAMARLKARAETIEAYDQMIGPYNAAGNAVVQAAIAALTEQTRTIERAVTALGLQPIEVLRSDSLDDPAKVFQ
jgi:putative iron-regulated protein